MGRGARTLSRDCRSDVIYKEKDDKGEVEKGKKDTEREREGGRGRKCSTRRDAGEFL